MAPDTGPPDPHSRPEDSKEGGNVVCHVCSTDLTVKEGEEEEDVKKRRKSKKADLKPGLIELRCEGTGFAGGGDNMVQRQGTAFQC